MHKTIIKYILLFTVFFCQNTFAQDITGVVIDEEKKPLEFVSVALLQPADSLLVKYTSTDSDGKFVLRNIKSGTYLFQIYLMTYQAEQRSLVVGDADMNEGVIQLKREVNELNEVTITVNVPIKIMQDTTAFNANAF